MFNDLKLSIRHLSRTPGFTAAAALVLALGIGLNAVMFSLCYLVVFAGRPFRDPAQMVQLYSRSADEPDSYRLFSHSAFRELAARRDVFAGVLAHAPCLVGLREGDTTRRTFAALVSSEYFDVLGVPMTRGRAFTAEEARPGRDVPVVVASYAFWKRTGFDPALLGREVRVNERFFTVVGITPEGFTGTITPLGPELFFPLGVFHSLENDFEGQAARTLQREDDFNLFLVARLQKGVSTAAAESALRPLAQSLASTFPAYYRGLQLSVGPLPRLVTSTRPANETALGAASLVFLGMTGAVLAIVCLNLASMLLARGQARRKELAVRLALGAGRARIVRQLLIEGLLLSALGATLGIVCGSLGTNALLSSLADRLPISIALEAGVSPMLIAGTTVLSVLATCLFALGPALRHSRPDLLEDLKLQAGQAPGARRLRFLPRHPAVALQIGLSLALVIAAGLFLRMARQAAEVDLGLRAEDTVIAEVDGGLAGYDETRGLDTYARIEDRLRALPGVRSASTGVTVPFGTMSLGYDVRSTESRKGPGRTSDAIGARWNAVGASYFDAMGVPIKAGRGFTDSETRQRGAPLVAVLDEVLARRLFPEGAALGRSFEILAEDAHRPALGPVEVVGVAGVLRDDLFDSSPGGAVYVPLAQGYRGNVHFHVRPADGTAIAGLRDAVRREIQATAPSLPLFRVLTFRQHLELSLEHWAVRLLAGFFTAVGGLATLVALVGIYGVKSYAVSRRTREIGVRVALGATPRRVLALVLGEGLHLALAGVALGSMLGVGVGRVLDAVFVEVSAFDALTFSAAPVLVLAACLAAAWLPARRATRVDPQAALRAE